MIHGPLSKRRTQRKPSCSSRRCGMPGIRTNLRASTHDSFKGNFPSQAPPGKDLSQAPPQKQRCFLSRAHDYEEAEDDASALNRACPKNKKFRSGTRRRASTHGARAEERNPDVASNELGDALRLMARARKSGIRTSRRMKSETRIDSWRARKSGIRTSRRMKTKKAPKAFRLRSLRRSNRSITLLRRPRCRSVLE